MSKNKTKLSNADISMVIKDSYFSVIGQQVYWLSFYFEFNLFSATWSILSKYQYSVKRVLFSYILGQYNNVEARQSGS